MNSSFKNLMDVKLARLPDGDKLLTHYWKLPAISWNTRRPSCTYARETASYVEEISKNGRAGIIKHNSVSNAILHETIVGSLVSVI